MYSSLSGLECVYCGETLRNTLRSVVLKKIYPFRSIGTPLSSSIETTFPCLYNCSACLLYSAAAVCLYYCQEPAIIQTGKMRLNWWRRGVPACIISSSVLPNGYWSFVILVIFELKKWRYSRLGWVIKRISENDWFWPKISEVYPFKVSNFKK